MPRTSQARLRAATLLLSLVPAGRTSVWAADGLAADAEIPVQLVGSPSWGAAQAALPVTVAVERDVRSGDRIIIPRGSRMTGHLVNPAAGGTGALERRLVFSDVVIHGKAHRVSARPVTVVLTLTRKPFYCGTPTLRGEPPFKLGEFVELSLPPGARWTVRLSRPLVLG